MAITCRSLICATFSIVLATAAAAQPLYESKRLTGDEYTFGIEGPAVNAAGVFYAVNFRRQGTIGRLAPGATQSELFAELPAGSIGVSIRFARGRMFVADYKGHNIFVFDGAREPRVYFRSDKFNQPNDMAIARDGTIYASDPHWKRRDGQVWRIAPAGSCTRISSVVMTSRACATTPVSSRSSRIAASFTVSPNSILPPGKPHRPASGGLARRTSKVRPS